MSEERFSGSAYGEGAVQEWYSVLKMVAYAKGCEKCWYSDFEARFESYEFEKKGGSCSCLKDDVDER